LSRLSPEAFSAKELRDYDNASNATNEPRVGEPMRDGIRVIRESLQQVDPDSVVLLSIE
jgi:hypothetical protein